MLLAENKELVEMCIKRKWKYMIILRWFVQKQINVGFDSVFNFTVINAASLRSLPVTLS